MTITATVTGTTNQAVDWTVSPPGFGTYATSGGSLTYTAPATIAADQPITVRATSRSDTSKWGEVTVQLTAVRVAVTPATFSVGAGGSVTFAATVTGAADTSVTWSVEPPSAGTIAAGVFTASAYTGAVTVRATSVAYPSQSGTASGTVVPTAVSVTGPGGSKTVSLDSGKSAVFTAAVTGPPNTSVTWTVSPPGVGASSISGNSLTYTAPNPITANQDVQITAASVASPAVSDSATVLLRVNPGEVCTLGVSSGTVLNGGGTLPDVVNCPAGVSWTASSPVTWARVTPAAGTGMLNVTIAADPAPTNMGRSATLTIAGKPFELTQSAASVVNVSPASITLVHDQTQIFQAYADNVLRGDVTWSVTGPGSIVRDPSSGSGNYTAPSIILPSETQATVAAAYPPGNGLGFASVYLQEYAPPNVLSVSPDAGAALTQTFSLTAGDIHGANSIDRVWINFSAAVDQFVGACYVEILSSTEYIGTIVENAVNLAADNGGWTFGSSMGTPGASIENAQCKIDLAASSLTRTGNYVLVNLAVRFKPGFRGFRGIYMAARNNTPAVTPWVAAGNWDLSANVDALPPTIYVDAPAANATVQGDVLIRGWAIDNTTQVENAVTGVRVFIDGQTIGYATLGISRPDVCAAYPGRPLCPNVGYQLNWNTRNWANGTHTLRLEATDGDYPPKTASAQFSVTVNNPPAVPLVISPSPAWVRYRNLSPTLPFEYVQFRPTVAGVEVTDVDWTLTASNAIGGISSTGLFTPQWWYMGPRAGWVGQVTGARRSNPAQTNTVTVTMMGVFVQDRIYVRCGESAWFLAGYPLTDYQVNPQIGSITPTGYYTAPNDPYNRFTVQITARETANANAKYITQITVGGPSGNCEQ